MKKLALILLFLPFIYGCEKTPAPADSIVVEGWIEEGGHPKVFLHKAVSINENESPMEETLRRSIVYSARVIVSDGTDSIQLIAKIDTTQLPPYYYHNVRITGEAGKTYTLRVEYKGQTLTSSTTIQAAVPIDSITVIGTKEQSTHKEVIIRFKDNAATSDYYALFYRIGQQHQYVLTSLGVRDDSGQQGETILWRVNRSMTILDNTKDFFFKGGDTLSIRLSHIDEEAYRYWSSFASTSAANTWIFMPKAQISTNIHGGLGYWCGYGSDEKQLIIPDRDTTFIYTRN